MKETNEDEYAFALCDTEFKTVQTGLTKREYFAAKALQGILSDSSTHGSAEDAVCASVRIADLLIEALNKQP